MWLINKIKALMMRQNNLHVIFNSPNYQPIRNYIKEFEELLLEHVNNKLLNNHENNIPN